MKNNLVLVEENKDLVVECLNGEFEFVHNTVDGSNWFNQKTLAKLFGTTQQSVSNKLKTYLKLVNESDERYKKNSIVRINLKINGSKSSVGFYNFKAVSYLAHRFNTPQAFNMLEWIDSSLNTMFNVATGKTDLDTKISKLENMYEVEEQKATDYLKASDVVSFDEELVDELMSKHITAKTNAENCKELIAVHKDWENCYENVVNRKELFKLVQVSNGRRKPSYRIYKGGEYVKGSIYYNKLVDWFNNEYPNAILLNRR